MLTSGTQLDNESRQFVIQAIDARVSPKTIAMILTMADLLGKEPHYILLMYNSRLKQVTRVAGNIAQWDSDG